MLISLFRIIKYGVQNFWRNGWLSASTVGIMILALFVFEGLILFNAVGSSAMVSIEEKVDISVYFKSNVPEDSILNVKRSVESLEEVKSVEYVSREDALLDFRNRHAEDEAIVQTLDELGENPLLSSLNIKAKELSQYGTIASYLETPSLQDIIEKVTYVQNRFVIDRLSRLIATLSRVIAALTLFLTFLAVVVTFNTIRLAIFANSEQIGIMRLVGASNGFIRGPFMVEGIIYGVVAAVVSFMIFVPIVNYTSPYVENFIREFNLAEYLSGNWLRLMFYQLAFALTLTVGSSFVAVRRYLKI